MSFPGIIRRLFANNGAGPKLRGDILPLNYGTCSTAAETAAKVVSLSGFKLQTGAEVTVSFTVTNTASSPTLNVNGTGAKPIQYRNAAIAAGYLAANRTYRFVYDGSSYELVGDVDTNTTYTAATAAPKAPASSAAVGTSAKYAREDHVHPVQESVTGSSGSCTGNAASASKLATKRTIGGVQFDGSANIHHYGACSTAAETAAKVVSLSGFKLQTGAEVTVSFTVTNTASSPTLNVNNTGAKPIQYRNAAIAAGYLAANRTYRFVYDGSSYELVGDVDTNTTYTAATAAPKAPASSAAVGTSAKYAREDHVHPVQESVTGSSGSCTGNAASASKLATKRTIGGVQFDGSANIHHYGACSTAAGTAAKTVALSGFVLATGAEITVKFSATNTASSPTLNVNNTGAKGIRYLGAAVAAGYLAAGRIYRLLYDGSYWNIVGDIYIHAGSVSEEQEALRLSMIGVPRYWRSTTLPAHHCWANGDFVEFADWPELKKVYDAGGFKGMLMAWNADEETQAANLGMWRPDAAKPTGLFTPNLSGQFFRSWGAGQTVDSSRVAGSVQEDAFQGHRHGWIGYAAITSAEVSSTGGPSSGNARQLATIGDPTTGLNGTPRTANETRPVNISQPIILYLGRPAQV